MENGILIGTGSLSWDGYERRSDRYGTIGVYSVDSLGKKITEGANLFLPALKKWEGKKGQLRAEVVETRKSTHIGDLFHGFFPTTPTKGEIILLGEGTLFLETSIHFMAVGLKPDDGRDIFWLNPEALYRAHEQTVNLFFIPE